MNANGFDAKVLGPQPGSASSVKMLRSVIMKGIEALAVESFVAAERQGILKEVMGCLGDVDATSFSGSLAMLAQTHIVHAHRRWEEMGLVAQTLRETGVDPLMTEAIEKSHRRTVDAHIAPADGKVPPLDEALKLLSEKVVRGASDALRPAGRAADRGQGELPRHRARGRGPLGEDQRDPRQPARPGGQGDGARRARRRRRPAQCARHPARQPQARLRRRRRLFEARKCGFASPKRRRR